MSRWRVTDWAGVVGMILLLSGYLLPWVKVGSDFHSKQAKFSEVLSENLDARLQWTDFLMPDRVQMERALDHPLEGVSGWVLSVQLRDEASAPDSTRVWCAHFLGKKAYPEKSYLVLAAGLLPALLGAAGLWVIRKPRVQAILGTALLAFYIYLRWMIAVSEGYRLLSDLAIGLGAWSLAYGILVAALALLLRSIFPSSRLI